MPTAEKPSLYNQVPSGWTFYESIYEDAVRTAPPGSLLIEVGSFWGKGAIYLAELSKAADKDLRCYAVDLWGMRPENNPPLFDEPNWCFSPGAAERGNIEPRIHREHHNSLFETFAHFVDKTKLSPDPLRIMRMDSLEAAEFFEFVKRPIHLLFLDDDHQYEHVIRELRAWVPLISSGGIIAGDDFTAEFDGVEKAVREYFPADQIELRPRANGVGHCWMVRL